MSKNEPIKNIELINSINDLKSHVSKENETKFFLQLKKAKFIIPVKFSKKPEVDSEGNSIFDNEVMIDLLMIKDIQDKFYFPAFLDYESLKNWNDEEEVSNLVVDFNMFVKVLNDEQNSAVGLAIDPLGLNIICNKQLINEIDKIEEFDDYKPLICEPKVYPTIIVDELTKYFKTNKNINKAFIKSIILKDNYKFLIVVDKECDDDVFVSMQEISKPLSKGIDIMFVNIDDDIAKEAIKENDNPFYKR